jgi:hypothetical protein
MKREVEVFRLGKKAHAAVFRVKPKQMLEIEIGLLWSERRDAICEIAIASACGHLKAQPLVRPRRLKTMAAGQKPVNAACNKLRPMKAVNSQNQGETKFVRARDTKIMRPAKARTALSMFMKTALSLSGQDRVNTSVYYYSNVRKYTSMFDRGA